MTLPNIDIRLMEEKDLENVRLLRNENSQAFFYTEQVSPEQQLKWWKGRDRSTLYFVGSVLCEFCHGDGDAPSDFQGPEKDMVKCWKCNAAGWRHVWQFSLSADGVLGNLAVASWAKGQGVAKHCVARVLVPGQHYWGLFRTDNPTILRFWPSMGFPEPSDDPPMGKPRGGVKCGTCSGTGTCSHGCEHCPYCNGTGERSHPRGSVQWVSHTWTEEDAQRHQIKPWYVEQAQRIAEQAHRNTIMAKGVVEKVKDIDWDYEAAACLCEGPISGDKVPLEQQGIPQRLVKEINLLHQAIGEPWLEHILRIKRHSNDVALEVKMAMLEHLLTVPVPQSQKDVWQMAWWMLRGQS